MATSAGAAPAPSATLRSASTILWVAGVLNVLISIAGGIPGMDTGQGFPFLPIGIAVLGTLFCVAGAMLRKRKKAGGTLALGTLVTALVAHYFNGSLVSGGAALALIALLLVVAAWEELG